MKDWKKSLAVVSALTMLVSATATLNLTANAVTNEKVEFENGTLDNSSVEKPEWNAVVDNTVEGFSGEGYVETNGGNVAVKVTVPSTGMYEIKVAYCLPEDRGTKNQTLVINGISQGDIGFTNTDTFKETSIGSFKLQEGENTIEFKRSWGWIMLDYLTIEEATLPELNVTKTLSDDKATDETKRLMCYLVDNYGEHIISGQQELYGQAGETEFDYIYQLSGEYPAIRGFDFMNTTQGVGWDDGTMSRIKDWVKNKNGIATASWHWNVPLDMDTYQEGSLPDWNKVAFYNQKGDKNKYTNFSPKKAVTAGTAENDFINKDLEIMAKQLLELQEEGIPIILRPLHEAEGSSSLDGSGSWFWWGNDGAEAYVQLYRYVYNKLVNEYGVHNVIWEWNSYTYETSSAWYPGDEYVDIVAYDKYNCDGKTPNESAITGTFYNLVEKYSGKKMVAMAENDTVPSLENLTSESAGWLYFCPWYDANPAFLTSPNYQNADNLKELYQSDYCITRDELPSDLYSNYSLDGFVNSDPKPTETTVSTQPTEPTTTIQENSKTYTSKDFTTTKDGFKFTVENPENISKIEIQGTISNTDKSSWFCAGGGVVVGLGADKTYAFKDYQFDAGKTKVTVEIDGTFKSGDLDDDGNNLETTGTITSNEIEITKWWASSENEGKDAVSLDITGVKVYYKDTDTTTTSETSDTTTEPPVTTSETDDTTTSTEPSDTVTTVSDTTIDTSNTSDTSQTSLTPSDVLLGDVTEDGNVKTNDLLLLKKYLLGLEELSTTAMKNADMNGDGDVKSNDLLLLKKQLLGLDA